MRSRTVANLSRHTLLIALVFLSFVPIAPVSAQEPEAPAAEGPTIVNVIDSDFEPQVTMIEVNGTVSWVHAGSLAHDVTGIDNDIRSPRQMGSGQTYQLKFNETGVYDYYCTLHSSGRGNAMWGRVIVVDEMIPFAGAAGEENPEHIGVRWLAHWVGIISFIAVFVTLIIYYFVLKYGETVHATDHRDRKEK